MKSLYNDVLDVAFHMISNRAFADFGSYFPPAAVVLGRFGEVLMFERVSAGLLGAAHSFVNHQPNKSRQINRRDVRSLDGFRRLGILFFIHDFSCRSPAVSALLRYAEEN